MGDFVKASTEPANILGAAIIGAGAIVGGPAGALAAASAVGAVAAQRQSAGAREVELELQQRQESSAARERAIARKRRLTAVLGAQSADAAARGVQMSGSVANISITDATRAAEDSQVDEVNTRLRIDALRRQRRSVARHSTARSATTILGAAERIAARG